MPAGSYLVAPLSLALLLAALPTIPVEAQETREPELQKQFQDVVTPFLRTYCNSCHGTEQPKGKLDLIAFGSRAAVANAPQTWETIRERLEAGEMPPEDARRQPKADERQAVIAWIRAERAWEAERHAGDPGIVPARRLSNAEYNYTIRDLIGVDLRPTREFPVDPANEAGFDNSADSLAMSPALLKKYVGAAREVADHLVLQPQGFTFAPHPVVTDTDRDKYCVKRIVEFYQRQPTDLAAYFLAAWKYHHRASFGQPSAELMEFAATDKVSPKYLLTVYRALTEPNFDAGPMAKLKALWSALPSPDGGSNESARTGCDAMRDFVQKLRRKLEPKIADLDVQGIHKGAQPFVLWKNRQYAAARRTYFREALQIQSNDGETAGNPDLTIPSDGEQRARYEASLGRFCDVFPDAFYISERGRDYVGKSKDQQEKGRLLSAGFHSMMGYFRDDQPLCDLILDGSQQAELDLLWQDFDFLASAPMRQYTGFVWFERTDSRFMRDPQFDFARSEDKDVTSEAKIKQLAELYLEKARANDGEGEAIDAIEEFFRNINAQIRGVEQARLAAEPSHLAALTNFAERAYRRPLSAAEREDLVAFYREMRDKEGATHEEAIQDALVSVLMSPLFCYRMDLAASNSAAKDRSASVIPLSDYELASRLSYFLWSSMPDRELLDRAAARDLHEPAVLASQIQRMMGDARIAGLATEFAGNWLDFRRFEQHNSVARERFPTFTNELRQAMFEEPIRFFVDLAQRDGSVLDFLYARHTFVNPVLARHYGLPDSDAAANDWARVEDATMTGRGGLLPMAVFLTQNSPGLRTSPVKRGYWVVRRLLGERIPPPPPQVPELPADESQLGELTLRETLAKHREHASCVGCHQRFDAFGLVFEGYGPIGERREVDLGGRPVDTRAAFPGGGEAAGVEGLKTYVREHRQEDFLDNLCRKLLSYALSRTLFPSDDKLVAHLREKLASSDYHFSTLLESIVTSPQFLTKRGI